ncbi:MAG: DUF4403 family protein [Chitinophagaceae bacterium]|nr:DUF4403 family protein [Chitinophagaceae bacterium]
MKTIKGKGFIFLASILCMLASCSPKIKPEKPSLVQTDFNLDSLPTSEINIPVQISLKPIYTMAEKNVDTLFTSPGYPDGWVQEGCDMRYKYVFRRSPLVMKAAGTSLDLGFTGFYKIVGSTRACVMGAAVSPWAHPCRCGFDEPERRVNVSFSNSISVQPDYKVKLLIRRNEPQALDKCEVCFWGQNITKQVMNGLKEELDAAKAALEKNYGIVDLRPRFQQVWDQLNKAYNIYGIGWLQMNPQRLRINNIFAKNDSLYVYLGLSARPVISFEKPTEHQSVVPNISDFSRRQGFSIYLDAVLNYDSLSQILNQKLVNKEFDFNKGPVKKKFIIKDCRLIGEGNEKLIIKIDFAGTDVGTFYLTGKPVYDQATKVLQVRDIDFDIKSKNALLKTAEWLFSKKITTEISKYTKYDLTAFFDTARVSINEQLNREWIKGIRSYGNIEDIKLIGIYPLSQFLVIRSNSTGILSVKVESAELSL